jgi:hypothetical protein
MQVMPPLSRVPYCPQPDYCCSTYQDSHVTPPFWHRFATIETSTSGSSVFISCTPTGSAVYSVLCSNAHHQLVTSPAALSGLLTLPVSVSERPSLIITVPSQGTHIALLQVWLKNKV